MPRVLRLVRSLDAVVERRECGANAEGGGGFQPGNTCGKGDGGGKSSGPSVSVSVSKKGTFLQAETDGGLVGGHVRDGALKITHAHLEPSKQGQGIGKAMYAKLIDEAHAQGLRVFSDTTVEVPAVRVYKSLEKDGYEVITNPHGVLPPSADLPDGAWYGNGDKPVFEVKPKNKGGASAGEASETVKAWAQKAFSDPSHAENFVRWFGDSKVVGDNGEPLLVHKGMPRKDWKTGKDIDAVQSTNGPWAGFFSDDKAVADRFAEAFKFSGDTQTLSGYAVIKKPHVIDAGGKPAKSVQFDQVVDGPSGPKVQVSPRIKEIIDSGQYDGIIIKNTSDEGTVFVPFNPESVKSSDNSGAFDPKSKNYKRSESRDCGANAEGGGGFQPGNTCGKGDGGGGGASSGGDGGGSGGGSVEPAKAGDGPLVKAARDEHKKALDTRKQVFLHDAVC